MRSANNFRVKLDDIFSLNQPPLRKAIRSARSFALPMPEKAIELPGAKPEGEVSHLSRLASDHLRVAFADRADE